MMGKKRKAGMPQGFTLELDRPDEDAPVRSGDYLDEVLAPPRKPTPTPTEAPTASPPPAPDSKVEVKAEPSPPPASTVAKVTASPATVSRTRLNVTAEGRKRLGGIVDHMKRFGPEPDVRASEVIEALILAMYEHREHLDMSNVRRRGKYGSATHKNFPITLAESVVGAMAAGQADKLI